MKVFAHEPLLLVIGLVRLAAGKQGYIPLTPGLVRKSEGACNEMAKQPFFVPDDVVGKPWRVYYMWNVKMDDRCVDIHFQKATPMIIDRIHYDMSRAIIEQPQWEAASLLMTIGRRRQEMLLIPDKGIPGRFLAVPNDFSDVMPGGLVPLLRFQMKLLRKGKFLVFIDCKVGIGSIASRFDETPYRMDIESVALQLAPFLGGGNHACVNEHNLLEDIVASDKDEPKKPPEEVF